MGDGKIFSIQSFRGGTGKSNIAGNLAALAAGAGKRVALLDTDFQSPGLHHIMGLPEDRIHHTFIDHLQDKCPLLDAAYDVTYRACGDQSGGQCWLFPASPTARAITQVINDGYDVNQLGDRLDRIVAELNLDHLIVDTHPGLNRETLLTTALSDTLILLLRPDRQDYQGTALYLEIARKLEIQKIRLLMNKLYSNVDERQLRERVERTFDCGLVGMLPLSEDVARNESHGLFCQALPDHAITQLLEGIMRSLFFNGADASATQTPIAS